jgi:multiple sugar transport system substrate-binding protein
MTREIDPMISLKEGINGQAKHLVQGGEPMKTFRDYFIYLTPIFILMLLILSACTGPSSQPSIVTTDEVDLPTPTQVSATQPPATTVETACSETVILTLDDWSSTDESRAARDEVLAAFQAANPCIEVEVVPQLEADADARRLEAIKAGAASDLIAVESSYIPAYTEAGGLADLTSFVENDPEFKPEDFFKGVWKSGFYQEKPRAIDKDFSTSAIYVNVDLFEKAGLALPTEGWTYDDYLHAAKLLTLDDQGRNATDPDFDPENIVQYGTTVPYWGGNGTQGWFRGFQNILYSFDAHALSPDGSQVSGYLNGDNALAAWTFARDLVHKYHVAPDTSVINAQTDGNLGMFKEGKLAIVGNFWGPWFQETLDSIPGMKWAVVPLPSGPAGHKGVIMWMGWGINDKTAHPQEAWELLKWLTTEPGQRAFARRAMTQYKPLAIELQRINDPFWGVFLSETEYVDRLDDASHPRFFSCVSIGPTADLLYQIWTPEGGEIDLKSRLDQLAAEADQCLSQNP